MTAIDFHNPKFPWTAPAKLNLFLHITGRRADGYHLLQTIFQFMDFGDKLYFKPTNNGEISLSPAVEGVNNDDNIIIKAARLLQIKTASHFGADITLEKNIPMGGGLGGGSSDAATTLLALNKLWNTNLSKQELMSLGVTLGADVPVFIYGESAWAEGVGEKLTTVSPPEPWYLIIFPAININTGTIFSSKELTRDKLPIRIRDFLNGQTENVFEPVVCKRYPEVQEAINWLKQFSEARMTGTGACIFASFNTEQNAQEVASQVPDKWQTFVTKGSNKTDIEGFYWGVAKR